MNKEMEQRKILMLVGIIPPYSCKDKYSKQMLEYYILKAEDSMPDLDWEIRELVQGETPKNIPPTKQEEK